MSDDLRNWTPRPRPERKPMEGRLVRLEPLDAARHGDDLFEASSVPDAQQRFRWLPDYPPKARAEYQRWLEEAQASSDPLHFAVVDKTTGQAVGRQTLMRIAPAHGVIEIGNVYWGPLMARTPMATEAQFLFAHYVFDGLGYRRYEWKCDNDNAPSKRAAERFGFTFEGIFRQDRVVKSKNRDTAWFSIVDKEWPALRQAYEGWLHPDNFDRDGGQKKRLEEFRK